MASCFCQAARSTTASSGRGSLSSVSLGFAWVGAGMAKVMRGVLRSAGRGAGGRRRGAGGSGGGGRRPPGGPGGSPARRGGGSPWRGRGGGGGGGGVGVGGVGRSRASGGSGGKRGWWGGRPTMK